MIGLATHMIDSTNIESLLSELEDPKSGDINKVIDKHALDATRADFISKLEQRSTWFAPASVDAIRHNLEQASSSTDDAAHLLELLNGASPYSLDVTKKLLTDTQGLALSECLIHEKAASMEAAFHADFIEGVRAVLVDKDRNPKWQASN